MQPTKPMAMTKVPVTMSRLAADSDGKEDDRVAKFPCVAASQMPTPRTPQPPSWGHSTEGERQGEAHSIQTAGARPAPSPGCTAPGLRNPQSHLTPEALASRSHAVPAPQLLLPAGSIRPAPSAVHQVHPHQSPVPTTEARAGRSTPLDCLMW